MIAKLLAIVVLLTAAFYALRFAVRGLRRLPIHAHGHRRSYQPWRDNALVFYAVLSVFALFALLFIAVAGVIAANLIDGW